MSDQLPNLVKGSIQRSYLEQDGWWATLVLDEFAFLQDLGYKLTGSPTAGVHFHQRGHYISYHGPRVDVSVGYDPDDTQTIDATVFDPSIPLFTPLDQLILGRHPAASVPRRTPLDRSAAEENVRWWAAGLRSIAPDVL
jgi:hypothetical protein